jgi:hypothetical protein
MNTNLEPGTRSDEQRRSPFPYSPDRRTAVVLCGTGAHGAYHAGVLRALQEAGVKVDVVAGHGVGAGAAALAAIDGAASLWDATGIWRSVASRPFSGWKPLVATTGWIAVALACVLLVPVVFLVIGLLISLLAFLVTLVGVSAGGALLGTYASALETAFAGDNLPTIVPRLAMLILAALVLVACAGVLVGQWRAPVKRRALGGWWWRLLAAPFEAESARAAFTGAIWQLIRGAAPTKPPASASVGRRYAEVLAENLGQPGFREVVLVANDVDARRDVVAALLREPFRREFLAPRAARDRRAEVLDLAGVGRDHLIDVVSGALTPPHLCDPAFVTFASDAFWRGETHRLCDRTGAANRLLEEVAAAGATQALIVTAVPPTNAPHALGAIRLHAHHRAGEQIVAAEAAALRDAIEMARLRFDGVYLVCPAHNPIGPFDFGGTYDEASDRRLELSELMERGYEDAYRQFIEPIIGDSGEQIARAAAPDHLDGV